MEPETKAARKRVREVLTVLTNVLPVPFPVRLDWRKMEGFGESLVTTKKDGKRSAVIRMRSGMEMDLAVEVLIHEFAHILSWDYHGRNHDAIWGIAYAEAYHVIYGEH